MAKKKKRKRHPSVLSMKEFMKGAKKSTLFEDVTAKRNEKFNQEECFNTNKKINKLAGCPFDCPC